MALKILIVHESTVIKNIIQDYILTDHPDASVDFSVLFQNTIEMLETNLYDVVFAGLEMKTFTGIDVYEHLLKSCMNSKTPLIIMTATNTLAERRRLMEKGIAYILPIPCTSILFRNMLYKVFNPNANTVHTLYTIPNSRAVIQMDNFQIQAQIINISTDSIVCELNQDKAEILKQARRITLQFPADYGKASTISMIGNLAGLKDILQDESYRTIRVTWKIIWNRFELHAATKKPLKLYLGRNSAASLSCEQINKKLESKIDMLKSDKQDLLNQVSFLKAKISEFENAKSNAPVKNISFSAMINEAKTSVDDSSKLSIFKRIIDDNVKLRKDS